MPSCCVATQQRHPDFTTVGALAVLQSQRGKVAEAERLFTEARHRFRGVSPFPVAMLDFRRGLMWLGENDLPAAHHWFDAAVRDVPAYGPALRHLAQLDAAEGHQEAAIDRLRRLSLSSDDPAYAVSLAGSLHDIGRTQEAEQWCVRAAGRYDQLIQRHPEAFIDHAAAFWLTVGGDPPRGIQLASQNLANRRAARARALRHRDMSPD